MGITKVCMNGITDENEGEAEKSAGPAGANRQGGWFVDGAHGAGEAATGPGSEASR